MAKHGRHKGGGRSGRADPICLLALMYRYLFPVGIILAPLRAKDKKSAMIYMGFGCILFALYSLIGYKRRWKHIYCAHQESSHQKMTPNRIQWDTMKKSEAYAIPAIFGVGGIAVILCAIFAV